MEKKLPKYTKNKMKGNTGEAFVQYILSDFALVHSIDGSNDIGNDFICELIRDEYPTNLLFYVQVKYTQDKPVIKKETLEYWKGSPIPVYVFWIREDNDPLRRESHSLCDLHRNITYKRCTPFLHKNKNQNTEQFKPFDKYRFLHDLMEDYSRVQLVKGSASILSPRDFLNLGEKMEMNLPLHILKVEMLSEYSKQILSNSWVNLYAIAWALRQKGGTANLKKSLEVIKLSHSLITQVQRKKYNRLVRNFENDYKEWPGMKKQTK